MIMSEKQSVDRETIRLFWQAAQRDKRLLALAALYPIGTVFMGTVLPLFIGKMLATLSQPHADVMHYVPYFVVAALIGLGGNRFGFAALLKMEAKAMSYLQEQAFTALLKRSVGFHNNHVGGKLVADTNDYPAAFNQLAGAMFINLIPFASVLVVGTVIVCSESWVLGLIIGVMATFALASGVRESLKRKPIRQARLKSSRAVTGHLADTILNVQTVKTFAHEHTELREHHRLSLDLLKRRLRDWQTAAYMGNNRMIVLVIMQLVFVLLVVQAVHHDPHLLGIGIFAFSFTITISNRLFDVNNMMRNIEEGLLMASPMTEILLQDTEIVDMPDAKPLVVRKGAVDFDTVDFQYPDSNDDQIVFADLQLNIAPGEKVGLVGPSGGGKSTLTRLLLRFDDVTSGQISIDGQNIAEVSQTSLRQAISYVPQEPLLFHRTVRENIAYGQPDATETDVIAAAKKANAHEFIAALPNGYETIVGERGVKLSGGQRQRVAIARAILKNAPILILDEATSALDSESEVLIQEALRKLMKGRTTIVIAHRLSTIQHMDRIVVLQDGTIAEQGTHAELLKHSKGTYAKLWKHQSGGFLEE